MSFIEGGTLAIGKYAGQELADVARDDPAYLQWIIDEVDDLDETEVDEIAEALEDARTARAESDDKGARALAQSVVPPTTTNFPWTDEQKNALGKIAEWCKESRGGFSALTGPAGTGKTSMVREIVSCMLRAALAATTGKAALRLSQCAGREATTLHSILYYPPDPGQNVRFERRRSPEMSTLIVDESSMITPQVFEDLKEWVREGVRILLVGDGYQLPPVISDKKDRDRWGEDFSVFAHVSGVDLREVMRSVGGVLRAATHVREQQRLCMESNEDYTYAEDAEPLEKACDDYCEDADDHLLITWRNDARMSANHRVRETLGLDDELPDDGEPVLIRKNGGSFLNGEIVPCGGWEDGPEIGELSTMWLTVPGRGRILTSFSGEKEFFDGNMPFIEDWKGYWMAIKKLDLPIPTPVTWGYCVTAHAAQGSEARRVTVFLERGDVGSTNFNKPTTLPSGAHASFSSRFLYTALTRAKSKATLYTGSW